MCLVDSKCKCWRVYNLDWGSKYYVTDLTVTGSSESELEEESDKVQVYLVHDHFPYHFSALSHLALWIRN